MSKRQKWFNKDCIVHSLYTLHVLYLFSKDNKNIRKKSNKKIFNTYKIGMIVDKKKG